MKKLVLSLMMAGLLAGVGCVDVTQVVELNEDGSGRVVETVYLSAAAMGMMAGMGDMGGGEGQANANPLMDEDKARDKVKQMGEGVAFVSIAEVSKPDGSKGAQTVYSFKDINKLKMSLDMSMGGDEKEVKDDEVPGFSFAKGLLTINMPKPKGGGEVEEVEEVDPQEQEMAMAMMQGMMPMFKGMKMRAVLKMPSEIKETNAKHVGLAPDTKKKQFITLMEMDMDTFLAGPDGMKKFMELQNIKDQSKAMKALEGMPGIKIETGEKISVKF